MSAWISQGVLLGATGATGPAGPTGGVFGSVIVDFGNADNGGSDLMVAASTVSAAWVSSTSYPIVGLAPGGDHTDTDDLLSEELEVYVTNIVIGVSFDVEVKAPNGTQGQWLVNWGAALTGSTPPPHAATHSNGVDNVTLAESQITNLVTDLAAKVPLTDVRMATAWQRYNAIRNPEMIVAQRGVGPTTAASAYSLDGWAANVSGTFVATWAQISAAIPPDASGSLFYPYVPYAYRLKFTTAQASISAGHYCQIAQQVEGVMASPLQGNTTSISFLVRSSVTGSFTVSLRDSAQAFSIVFLVTIASASVWQRVTIQGIPTFSASGSFPDGTALCYNLSISPVVGSTFITSTLGSWVSGNFFGATGQSNFANTINTTFDFTLVQHEPNAICTPYVKRSLSDEISLSLRYLLMYNGLLGIVFNSSNTNDLGKIPCPSVFRATPTLTSGSVFTVNTGSVGVPAIIGSSNGVTLLNNSSANWTVGAVASFNGGLTAEL